MNVNIFFAEPVEPQERDRSSWKTLTQWIAVKTLRLPDMLHYFFRTWNMDLIFSSNDTACSTTRLFTTLIRLTDCGTWILWCCYRPLWWLDITGRLKTGGPCG